MALVKIYQHGVLKGSDIYFNTIYRLLESLFFSDYFEESLDILFKKSSRRTGT